MCVEGLGKSLANLDYNSVRRLDIPSLRFLAFFFKSSVLPGRTGKGIY